MTSSTPPTDPWVTGTPPAAQRVPGIHDTPDTTYVDESTTSWRRPALIGLAVGLGITAVVAAVVLGGDSTDEAKGARAGPSVTRTAPPASSTTTTSTTAPAVVVPATLAPTTTTAPRAVAPAPGPAPAATPTPRATANPSLPVYTPVALPDGVGGTITACSWQPTGGGQYQAAGTLTNGPRTGHGWTVTVHWLQNGREVGTQSTLVDIGAGQSKPWLMAMGAPVAPADPFSCALSVA